MQPPTLTISSVQLKLFNAVQPSAKGIPVQIRSQIHRFTPNSKHTTLAQPGQCTRGLLQTQKKRNPHQTR